MNTHKVNKQEPRRDGDQNPDELASRISPPRDVPSGVAGTTPAGRLLGVLLWHRGGTTFLHRV